MGRERGLVIVAALAVLAVALSPATTAQEAVTVRVLLDFGDGFVYWQEVDLGENRTALRATELAAEALGFDIEVTWFAFGAFVSDIGDRDPTWPVYWHFLLWNETAGEWDLSSLGASNVTLDGGDVIGWYLTADDPDWDFPGPWPGPRPLPTPTHPYPVHAFRADVRNTGTSRSPVPGDPALKWAANLDGAEVGASTVGARGTVYQVTWNATHALDLATGKERWRTSEVRGLSTPALVGEDLVVGSRDGALYRLDGATGAVEWSLPLVESPAFTGIASSPVVHDGRVLVGTFNESGGPGRLVSIHASNGTVAWSVETGSIHMSSPAMWNGSVYVGVMGRFQPSSLTWGPPYGLLSVHAGNGTERWFFPADGPVAASPAVTEDAVFVTTRNGSLHAVSPEGDLLFQRPIGPSTSSPLVLEDRVVVASGVLGTAGRALAFDLAGGPLWEFVPNGPVQASLTGADGLVLFATNAPDGRVYALGAEDGAVAWSYTPEPNQYLLPTPVVLDGIVLQGSDSGFLYALTERTATLPQVQVTSPASGAVLASGDVVLQGTASDDVEVVRVEASPDGATWIEAEGTSSWEVALTLPEGTHTLTVRVTDNAGNANTTRTVVTVALPEAFPLVYLPVIAGVGSGLLLVAAVLWYARRLRRG